MLSLDREPLGWSYFFFSLIKGEKHEVEELTDPGTYSRRFPPTFMLKIPSSSPFTTYVQSFQLIPMVLIQRAKSGNIQNKKNKNKEMCQKHLQVIPT